jgi:hypothetical protein
MFDNMELLTVGEPTIIALDLKTSTITLFLSALAMLNTLTIHSLHCLFISEAIA